MIFNMVCAGWAVLSVSQTAHLLVYFSQPSLGFTETGQKK